jgi:putative heme-binding domain-containing protein
MTRPVQIRGELTKWLIGLCAVHVFLTWTALAQEALDDSAEANRDRLVVETLLRLEGYDLESNAKAKASVLRHLKRQEGKPEYVKLARHFTLKETVPVLLELAVDRADETVGAEAISLVVTFDSLKQIRLIVEGKHTERAARALLALGHLDDRVVRDYLKSLVSDSSRSRSVRNAAARSLGRSRLGERELLDLARAKKVLEDTRFAVGNILLASGDPALRTEAGKYFKLPAGSNATPLPPIAQLIKISGDVKQGKKLFETTANCAKCHKVLGAGKDVGPDLSEIGSKLSREAMYVSILDPSAGISHNYETYLVELTSGNVLSGVLVSQTAEMVVIKTSEAIEKAIARSDIELMQKSEISLMPADLVKTQTKETLADIVEYLASLKKKAK